MISFGIIFGLVALASARPDVSLGYRYPQPGGGGSIASIGSLGSLGSLGGGLSSIGSGLGVSSGLGGSYYGGGGGSVVSSSGGYHSEGHHGPIITKHFHIYSGPAEEGGAVKTKQIVVGQPQKHYRVVFIKAPAAAAGSARVSVQQAPHEEKTVIYVLAQKQDELNLESDVAASQSVPSKPEVFFIRYKTDQEAQHAQQQIQSQYDSLGGTSQVTDEGQAQVSSVVGSVGGGGIGASSSGISSVGSLGGGFGSLGLASGGSSSYLPPSH